MRPNTVVIQGVHAPQSSLQIPDADSDRIQTKVPGTGSSVACRRRIATSPPSLLGNRIAGALYPHAQAVVRKAPAPIDHCSDNLISGGKQLPHEICYP